MLRSFSFLGVQKLDGETDMMRQFRQATVDDVDGLNALTSRLILHWGYESEFVDWEPEAITVTRQSIFDDHVLVLEHDEVVIGYYGLRGSPEDLSLDKLFLEPSFIGKGLGRRLCNHAVETARNLGVPKVSFFADPNATGFYRAMGSEWIREEPTSRPGWNLQVFSFELTPESRE